MGFLSGSDGKESGWNAGDLRDAGSSPGWGRSPGEGNDYPLHYSCLENPMDRGPLQATFHGVSKSQTQLSMLIVGQFTKIFQFTQVLSTRLLWLEYAAS